MMNLKRFRKGKNIDLINSFQSYCAKNKKNYQSFKQMIEESNNLKKVINNFDSTASESMLKNYVLNCLSYINLLTQINQTVKIGDEKGKWDVKFTWTNVSTGKSDSECDCLFEVCSVKFNMGVCFSLLGFVNLNSKDENKLKISKQYFEKSAYVFDELRINSKNIANLKVIDFSQEYLTICLNVALAFSQYYIYQFGEIKNMKLFSKAKLIAGAYLFLDKALQIKFSKTDKTLIKCLNNYFHALALHFFGKDALISAEKRNVGLGIVYGYEGYAYELLDEIKISDFNKIEDDFKVKKSVENLKLEIQSFLNNNYDRLNNLFKEAIVKKEDLPSLQSNQLAKTLKYEESAAPVKTEKYHGVGSLNSMEDSLSKDIPDNLKVITYQYKEQLQAALKKEFNKYYTSEKILKFLSEKNLPYVLEPFTDYNPAITPNGEIVPDERIKNVILFIKGKGGINYIKDGINQIDETYNSILQTLNKYKGIIYEIKEEDKNNKILYGDQWMIESPIEYQNNLKYLKQILENSRKKDEEVKNAFTRREKHIEVFEKSEEEIFKRIPNPIELTTNLNSTKILKSALNTLSEDEQIINKFFDSILEKATNSIPVSELSKVQKKQQSLNNVIENELKHLSSYFNDIQGYSQNIERDIEVIREKFSLFEKETSKIQNEGYNKAIAYFTKIQDIFVEIENLLFERLNEYNNFKNKGLMTFQGDFDGYLLMRKIVISELKENLEYQEKYKLAH